MDDRSEDGWKERDEEEEEAHVPLSADDVINELDDLLEVILIYKSFCYKTFLGRYLKIYIYQCNTMKNHNPTLDAIYILIYHLIIQDHHLNLQNRQHRLNFESRILSSDHLRLTKKFKEGRGNYDDSG